MTGSLDKRRHHRFLALLDVRVLPGEVIPSDLKLATIDVALGGVRCGSNRPLPDGARLQISLTLVGGGLPVPASIEADAKVLRCAESLVAPAPRRYEVALEFVRMDPQDRRRLQAYLNNL